MRRTLIGAGLISLALVAGCGAERTAGPATVPSTSGTGASGTGTSGTGTSPAALAFSARTVDGDTVDFAALSTDLPVMLWFWAPT